MEYINQKIKKQILKAVIKAVGEVNGKLDLSKIEISVPPKSDMGDLAVPCFYFSKFFKKAPDKVAIDLAKKVKAGPIVKEVKAIGPYLNFFLDPKLIAQEVIDQVNKAKDDYGRLKLSKDKIMIEFSQPNTHKEFHIGHSRNAILGQSLVNLYSFAGYKVIPVSYIGDVGAHVAKCLWALKKFHQDDKVPEDKGRYLGQIYTEAAQKIAKSKKAKAEADEILQKLEGGDKEWNKLWEKTRKWSLDDFAEIHKLLGIKFDHIFYESEAEKPGKEIVNDLLKKGIAKKSQGAIVIDLTKYDLKVFLLLRSDGSSLYSTKDLALAEMKFKKYKIDQNLMVIDSRQSFYLKQLFKTLEVIGFNKPMTHVAYEFVTLKDGAMASREGNVVLFKDFYNQVLKKAEKETLNRHKDWSEKKIKKTAKQLALSAIKFNMLKTGNDNIIVFDIDEALSFDGYSGPYLQYTSSRINSVIKKAKSDGKGADFSKLTKQIEKELVLKISDFPIVVAEALKINQPSEVARYLFELAKLFSAYYQKIPILNSPNEIREARLGLLSAVRQVLINGLGLLGIKAMKQM